MERHHRQWNVIEVYIHNEWHLLRKIQLFTPIWTFYGENRNPLEFDLRHSSSVGRSIFLLSLTFLTLNFKLIIYATIFFHSFSVISNYLVWFSDFSAYIQSNMVHCQARQLAEHSSHFNSCSIEFTTNARPFALHNSNKYAQLLPLPRKWKQNT